MRYIDEYRDGEDLRDLAEWMAEIAAPPMRLMEVCGTHTMAIARHGLRSLVPSQVELLSGPGCPVCVTPQATIDHFLALGRLPDVTLATFGDMLRVPGTEGNLEEERARGADVRIVYSAIDAISIARNEPDRQVVFFGIGFETTAPGTALVILEAKQQGLENFSVLSAHKALPPALRALAASPALNVQGFLCPGHVTAIIGREAYRFLADDFRVPCVVTGFEPLDVMQGVALLVRQVTRGEALVEIQYARAVRPEGNPRARKVMDAVFQPADSAWRGLGEVSGSGMAIAPTYAAFDAARKFPIDVPESPEPAGCRCGEVLCGALRPDECGLFGDGCTPAHPIGPCMVSSEGACAAWYRYGRAGEGDDE